MQTHDSIRILMYSHDTYGLGHIRRSLAIAKSIRSVPASVLIVTGSPLVGRFVIPEGIDFVRIPGMIKVTNEEYTPLSMKLPSSYVISIREDIILATAKSFRPHFFIVDKAPLGLRKEVQPTLEWIRSECSDCTTILGLRDIMDRADETIEEWRAKNIYEAMKSLYDEIWVYGVREFYDPVKEYQIPPNVAEKLHFTGYIPRDVPSDREIAMVKNFLLKPLFVKGKNIPVVLITAGGGGDGHPIFDTFLRAFEQRSSEKPEFFAVLVTGPFMDEKTFRNIRKRASRFGWKTIKFYRFMEALIAASNVVVSMGGYNTICEVFTLKKPALIVPRCVPREEQLIRAKVLCEHGFCEYIPPDNLTPEIFREKILFLLKHNPIDSKKFDEFPFTAFQVILNRIHHHLAKKGLS